MLLLNLLRRYLPGDFGADVFPKLIYNSPDRPPI
jgi:hypothetical protein